MAVSHPHLAWLTTSAVALQCGVTPRTVRNWAQAGVLKGKRTPGGHYRFDPNEVGALLREDTTEAVA